MGRWSLMHKAQVFLFDLITSTGIFITSVVIFIFLSNALEPGTDEFSTVSENSKAISSSLLSGGEPANWTADNVAVIGMVDESYRLNFDKLRIMHNISLENSSRIFGATSNFAIFFKDIDGNVLNMDGCSYSNAGIVVANISESICQNITIIPERHLVSVERLLLYDSDIIKLVVQSWI
jgi:hypothetical protein